MAIYPIGARRISGFSVATPVGGAGLQLYPSSDNSFSRAQDERELRDEIWQMAVREAYGAKDGERRLQKMVSTDRLQVIEAYFAEQPEIRDFVDRNIKAGTCADAVKELRAKRDHLRKSLQDQRGKVDPPPLRDPAMEWLRQAAAGR